jgi:hypothetical protein
MDTRKRKVGQRREVIVGDGSQFDCTGRDAQPEQRPEPLKVGAGVGRRGAHGRLQRVSS